MSVARTGPYQSEPGSAAQATAAPILAAPQAPPRRPSAAILALRGLLLVAAELSGHVAPLVAAPARWLRAPPTTRVAAPSDPAVRGPDSGPAHGRLCGGSDPPPALAPAAPCKSRRPVPRQAGQGRRHRGVPDSSVRGGGPAQTMAGLGSPAVPWLAGLSSRRRRARTGAGQPRAGRGLAAMWRRRCEPSRHPWQQSSPKMSQRGGRGLRPTPTGRQGQGQATGLEAEAAAGAWAHKAKETRQGYQAARAQVSRLVCPVQALCAMGWDARLEGPSAARNAALRAWRSWNGRCQERLCALYLEASLSQILARPSRSLSLLNEDLNSHGGL